MNFVCVGSSSKGNAYALISENDILLLETGCRLIDVKKAINFQIGKVVGCLATHGHKDHLGYVKEYLEHGITVYTNDETASSMTITGEKLKGMPEMIRFEVGGFKVTPFYVPHNDCPNFAYLIEHKNMGKMIFATDFEYMPYTFKQHRLNHLLIECNHMDDVDRDNPNYEHILKGHSSLSTVLDIVEKNRTVDLRTITLCHLSHSNADPVQMVEEVGKVAGFGVQVLCAEAELSLELKKEPF